MINKDMEKFMKSGKITDYLEYAKCKKERETEFSKELDKGESNDKKGRNCNKNN